MGCACAIMWKPGSSSSLSSRNELRKYEDNSALFFFIIVVLNSFLLIHISDRNVEFPETVLINHVFAHFHTEEMCLYRVFVLIGQCLSH